MAPFIFLRVSVTRSFDYLANFCVHIVALLRYVPDDTGDNFLRSFTVYFVLVIVLANLIYCFILRVAFNLVFTTLPLFTFYII